MEKEEEEEGYIAIHVLSLPKLLTHSLSSFQNETTILLPPTTLADRSQLNDTMHSNNNSLPHQTIVYYTIRKTLNVTIYQYLSDWLSWPTRRDVKWRKVSGKYRSNRSRQRNTALYSGVESTTKLSWLGIIKINRSILVCRLSFGGAACLKTS